MKCTRCNDRLALYGRTCWCCRESSLSTNHHPHLKTPGDRASDRKEVNQMKPGEPGGYGPTAAEALDRLIRAEACAAGEYLNPNLRARL